MTQQPYDKLSELSDLVVDEEVVLRKYAGDLTEEEMANATPIEEIVIKNGEVISVTRREDTE